MHRSKHQKPVLGFQQGCLSSGVRETQTSAQGPGSYFQFLLLLISLLDAIASPSTYPCQSVIVSDLEITITSPRFASLFSFCLFQFLRFTGSCLCLSLFESAGHKGKWGNHKAWLTSSQHFKIFKQTTIKHFEIYKQKATKHVKIFQQATTKHCQTHITQEVGVFVWTSLQC